MEKFSHALLNEPQSYPVCKIYPKKKKLIIGTHNTPPPLQSTGPGCSTIDDQKLQRDPIIRRAHYVRIRAIEMMVMKFFKKCHESYKYTQILSLGAGYVYLFKNSFIKCRH